MPPYEKNESASLENATDTELVEFLIGHIDNPCSVEVEEGVRLNIREFYLREADQLMEKLTNEYAKNRLRLKIEEYRKKP